MSNPSLPSPIPNHLLRENVSLPSPRASLREFCVCQTVTQDSEIWIKERGYRDTGPETWEGREREPQKGFMACTGRNIFGRVESEIDTKVSGGETEGIFF